MFSNIEIEPKFSINHNKSQKLYFEPQLLTQKKNISFFQGNFLQNFISKQDFTPKHWWNEVGIVTLATQNVSRI